MKKKFIILLFLSLKISVFQLKSINNNSDPKEYYFIKSLTSSQQVSKEDYEYYNDIYALYLLSDLFNYEDSVVKIHFGSLAFYEEIPYLNLCSKLSPIEKNY